MANNPDSILLTISDMVSESIKNKTLHQDYNDILVICRDQKISSYALHQIIESELVRKETISNKINRKSIGFVKLVMPKVTPTEDLIENNDCRHTKSTVTQTKENEYVGNESNKKIKDSKVNHKWGWKTWILFILMATVIAGIFTIVQDSPTIKSIIRYKYLNILNSLLR